MGDAELRTDAEELDRERTFEENVLRLSLLAVHLSCTAAFSDRFF